MRDRVYHRLGSFKLRSFLRGKFDLNFVDNCTRDVSLESEHVT